MDPLTAFGIACNVMQILSFSHEIFTLARRIAHDGSPDASLADKSAHLSDLSEDLQGSLKKQQETKHLTEQQQRLQKVAKKCLGFAKDLAEELDNIKWKSGPSGSDSKVQRRLLSQTWKAWWGKSKIDKLEKEMTQAEQAMQSTMLSKLWLSNEAASLQQDERFKALDDRLQHFIRQYARGCRQLSDLVLSQATDIKEVIVSENVKTRVLVSAQLCAQESARVTMGQCERLVNSLTYATMNARKSRVAESYENTFQWIFDDTIARPWDSFSKWLKSDQRIYWIYGKPGSGKSTLMKFLVEDARTRDALEECATNPIVISFFLWNAGTIEQRSVQGVLCSLLHQLLMTDQPLVAPLLADQPDLLSKSNYNDWSDKELEQALLWAMDMSTRPLCVFLDGLDEFDRKEDCFTLISLIQRLRIKSNAKLCISSRPETPLQNAFSGCPKLRLQDVTKSDISSVVADFLQDLQFRNEKINDKEERQDIINEVVRRADGVFLWVHLVLKSLRRGSVHLDSYEEILGRISRLPSDLEDLYKQAWKRHGEDESHYRAEAARYFRLVLEARRRGPFYPPFSLFDLCVAHDEELQKAVLEDKVIPSVPELLRKAEDCRRRVESCCGGLLEIWETKDETYDWGNNPCCIENIYCQFLMPLSAYVAARSSAEGENISWGGDLGSLWNIFYSTRVDFIHRTAVDFLVEAEWGKNIIDSDPAAESDITTKIYQCQLIRILLFGFPWANLRHTSDDFVIYVQDLPSEMHQGLITRLGDVCGRLLDRAPFIESIIKQCRLQIRNGEVEGQFYKTLCDLINSTAIKHLPSLHAFSGGGGRFLEQHMVGCVELGLEKYLPYIHKASLPLWAGDKLNSTSWPPQVVKWPIEVPKEVIRYSGVSPDDPRDRLSAYLVFTTWILVDARRDVRYHTIKTVIRYFSAITDSGILEGLRPLVDSRRRSNQRIENLLEILLYEASDAPTEDSKWRSDEVICWLLQSGADPNWKKEELRPGRLTPFATFLLSVLTMCSSTSSITKAKALGLVTTLRAYISAGADLGGVISVSRGLDGSSTWGRRCDHRNQGCITIECNISQLVEYGKASIQSCLDRQGGSSPRDLENLGHESYKPYRKVLLISKHLLGMDEEQEIRCVAVSEPNSRRIFDLLDSKTGVELKGEMHELLTGIIESDVQVADPGDWLICRGSRPATLNEERRDYNDYWERGPIIGAMYKALFPDSARYGDLEADVAEFEAKLWKCSAGDTASLETETC